LNRSWHDDYKCAVAFDGGITQPPFQAWTCHRSVYIQAMLVSARPFVASQVALASMFRKEKKEDAVRRSI